jgi:hypothetical protein
MSYPTKILFPERIVELTLKTLATLDVSQGDLLGYSSGWVLADADAATNIYTQYVAMQNGKSGQTIKACQKCILFDEDAPWTANTAQYLSGTAGGITETRPATAGDLIQIVGRSLDTTRCMIDIKAPTEFELFLSPDEYDTSSEPGLGKADTGWSGIGLTGTETCYFKGRLPAGLIGTAPTVARLIGNSINASAGDVDVSVVGAYDGSAATVSANNQDTGTALTTADWVQADADNKILWVDVSSCFDADFYKPERNFSVLVDPDGITGELQIIGLYIRGFKV